MLGVFAGQLGNLGDKVRWIEVRCGAYNRVLEVEHPFYVLDLLPLFPVDLSSVPGDLLQTQNLIADIVVQDGVRIIAVKGQ